MTILYTLTTPALLAAIGLLALFSPACLFALTGLLIAKLFWNELTQG